MTETFRILPQGGTLVGGEEKGEKETRPRTERRGGVGEENTIHGLITTTKKRMIILGSPAPLFTPVVPSTPTLSKGYQELLEDKRFIDEQLA